MGLFSFLASGDNRRQLNKLDKTATAVLALEEKYKAFTDDELRGQADIFKKRLAEGETLDDVLCEAFAVVREASTRVLKMTPFKVQVMGGIALHQGRVAEMKTGEGKTLVATLPAYLNALTGEGVHVVTVNDYLARTQSEQMGMLFNFLGLSVGLICAQMPDDQRKAAYNADITYGTNNEFGFDYLRDNLKIRLADKVQRGLAFAIVDEVDSILIDEARTPLIISGAGGKSSDLYIRAQRFYRMLSPSDYEVDEKERSVSLTEEGGAKAERFFNVENISDIENKDLHHYIQQALKANILFKKDNDYIVTDGEVIIVDEFTGRLMIGRRYSDGLHQAIEAKENVVIRSENKTHATITFQNYFRLYTKLSGMTGTAKTEEDEFRDIYSLDVIEIPTNKPMIRKDLNDVIYPTHNGKMHAIVKEIEEKYTKGQPVLVGTVTVEKSEELSDMLNKAKVPHTVLNAKNHAKEAEIVAQAGRLKAVTIATNMAGRGTDILLGGNPEFMAQQELRKEGIDESKLAVAFSYARTDDEEIKALRERYTALKNTYKEETDKEHDEVVALGGLHIIGTERHESRRIDNQLRGRAGRQGDIGSSVFYISLEDDLAKRFGGETIQRVYEMMKVDEDTALSMNVLSGRIEQAQKVIEGKNYSVRKNVLEYDNVMNKQREVIYGERDKVLAGESMHKEIVHMIEGYADSVLANLFDTSTHYTEWNYEQLNKTLEETILQKDSEFLTVKKMDSWDIEFAKEQIHNEAVKQYEDKVANYKADGLNFDEVERVILLRTIDDKWVDHIDEMDMLRRGISLRAYAQIDPVVAYKSEAFDMFEDMESRIQEDTAKVLLKAEFKVMPTVEQKEAVAVGGSDTTGEKVPARAAKTPGRNDPCPCGSGKKYKNCCGK